MIRLLLDADLPRALYSGLGRVDPDLDVIPVQQVGLRTAGDPDVLEFAAREGRIVVTKDKATMRNHAADRVSDGRRMPGLLVVRPVWLRGLSRLGEVIEELVLINACTSPEDWENVIFFLPQLR